MEDSLANFINRWNKEAKDCPAAVLDFTWPSISLCELIILPLIGKRELVEVESEIVGFVVNYCAEFVRQIWQNAGITSTIERGSTEQLELVAWEDGFKNKIELEKILRFVISERPYPLRIFSSYFRNISTPHGLIAPILLGVTLGLHPEYDGLWADQAEGEADSRITKVTQSLASSVSAYCQRVFPNDVSSEIEQLYLEGAIYPPIGMRERYPLAERAKSFVNGLKKLNFTNAQILSLAEKLVQIADYQISGIALVIIGALGNKISPELCSKCERFGRSAGFLRPAVIEVKKLLQQSHDWIDSTSEAEVNKIFQYESKLGLLPFFFAPAFDAKLLITNAKVKDLYCALAVSDVASALALSADITVEDPKLINIRLQRIYLELLTGAIEDADLGLRGLLTEPGAEEDWRVYSLLATTATILGNFEDMARYSKFAFDLCPSSSFWFDIVCNDFARLLVGKEEREMGLEIVKQGLAHSLNPLALLLTQIVFFRLENNRAELTSAISQLVKISPLDPRVFTERFLRS